MRTLGVPYEAGYEKKALADLQKQALEIATDIANEIKSKLPEKVRKSYNSKAEINKLQKKELIALIAYLQRLGKDVSIETKINNK